ncbi:MAG: hypothetical protein ABI688_01190 [Bacteroidota bacterium]
MSRHLAFIAFVFLSLLIFIHPPAYPCGKQQATVIHAQSKIQAAILLDVSNSMDGLIEQAKSQLWNMAIILDKVRCGDDIPKVEIALYEYGRRSNESINGYVKQISAFTTNLDLLFQKLNDLNTNGGDEYCGHAINSALDELDWDNSALNYKVIFIAGNEDFFQGDISYIDACKKAKMKGVIVNTIFCGDKTKGISEGWNLGADCSNGSFSNIDQTALPDQTRTPYDSIIVSLNNKLNDTYVPFGIKGEDNIAAVMKMDTMATSDISDPSKIIGYIVVKSNNRLNDKSKWDLAAAIEKDSTILERINADFLPDDMKNKSLPEIKKLVKIKSAERDAIRQEIEKNAANRANFIKEERVRLNIIDTPTLKTEIERIVSEQVARFNMKKM